VAGFQQVASFLENHGKLASFFAMQVVYYEHLTGLLPQWNLSAGEGFKYECGG
jgi:hypothetical protein